MVGRCSEHSGCTSKEVRTINACLARSKSCSCFGGANISVFLVFNAEAVCGLMSPMSLMSLFVFLFIFILF